MKTYRVACLPGDGIGPEVVEQARKVVDALGGGHGFKVMWLPYPFGAGHYEKTNEILPDSVLPELEQCDAMLLGAVGSPSVRPGLLERGILLKLRFHFDQYINLRPARSFRGVSTPVPLPEGRLIDSVVVRENTEDFYMGIGAVGEGKIDVPVEVRRGLYELKGKLRAQFSPACAGALQVGALTRPGIERVTRYAFETAKKRGEKEVVLASKANAVPDLYGFLDEETRKVAENYPGIRLRILNVDALCYQMVRAPADWGTILCPNLFGDIVSDLQSALIGGLGLGAGGNIGDRLSMFEPIHGSAPDIAGTGKANPVAAILSAALLLDHVGESKAAGEINDAVADYLMSATRREKPVELGGEALCAEVGDSIAANAVR